MAKSATDPILRARHESEQQSWLQIAKSIEIDEARPSESKLN